VTRTLQLEQCDPLEGSVVKAQPPERRDCAGCVQGSETISGDTEHVVIGQTNSGYAANPGHARTGTVVAQI
jgi:hypothetical protein